ncbi:MAG TPA: hypothetical protein VKF62_10070, partial [Planctomycetota bacterium]|nr:hypothetical protein [Planctomycetota bacterium]
MRNRGAKRLPFVLLLLALLGAAGGALLLFSGGGTPGVPAPAATTGPLPDAPPPDEPPVPVATERTAPAPERQELRASPETRPGPTAAESPPATLEARIVDSSGSPLQSARVRFGEVAAFSGADGLVVISFPSRTGLDRWNVRCHVSLPGYATRLLEAEVEAGRRTRLG